MAKLTIDEAGKATVTMDNGLTVPVRDGWESIEVHKRAAPELIRYPDGSEAWFTHYDRILIEGLAGDLADGETFTSPDGCTSARYGDKMAVWWTPANVEALVVVT
jgi:hypothetical protein